MVPIRIACWLSGRSLSTQHAMINVQIITVETGGMMHDAWLPMVCGKVVEFGPTADS